MNQKMFNVMRKDEMTKQKLTDKLRLEIIEGLVELYYNTDCSLKIAGKIIDDMYMVAHPKARCPHKDWDRASLKMYKRLKKVGIL